MLLKSVLGALGALGALGTLGILGALVLKTEISGAGSTGGCT